jgi:hypothetical protein
MSRTMLPIKKIRLFAILGIVISGVVGWCRFHPRFAIPDEVKNTPVEIPLRRELAALTANQGWYQTDVWWLTELSEHSAIGDRFELIRTDLLPSVKFYSVFLRRYHCFYLHGVNAPFDDLVIAVDGQSDRVWSFHSGRIHSEMIPFLRAFGVAIHDEKDVVRLWQLFSCLHPFPITDCEVYRRREDEWVAYPKDSESTRLCAGLRIQLDSEHYVRGFHIQEREFYFKKK